MVISASRVRVEISGGGERGGRGNEENEVIWDPFGPPNGRQLSQLINHVAGHIINGMNDHYEVQSGGRNTMMTFLVTMTIMTVCRYANLMQSEIKGL